MHVFEKNEFSCRPAGPNSVAARQLCSRDLSLTLSLSRITDHFSLMSDIIDITLLWKIRPQQLQRLL